MAWTCLVIISIVVFHRVLKVVRSDEAYQPLVRQVTIFAWIYHVQLILRYIIFTALEGLWVYDSIIIVKKNIAAEGRRQEIALVTFNVD